MEFQPTKAQDAYLRVLYLQPTGAFQKHIKSKPAAKTADRTALADAGLLLIEKRKPPTGRSALDYCCLTDSGRAWVEQHAAPPPPPAKVAKPRKAAVPKPRPSLHDFNATPKQLLLLLRLMLQGSGSVAVKDLEFKPSDADVKKFIGLGLVLADKATLKRGEKFETLELAEPGWLWVEQHLDCCVPGTNAEARVFHRMLARIKQQIVAGRVSLADLCQPPGESTATASERQHASGTIDAPLPDERPQPTSLAQVRQRVLSACHKLSDGAYQTRVRLADLRAAVAEIPRGIVDQALLDLEQSYAANIYPLDNPQEIESRDVAAALPNSMGSPRHILYLTGKE